MNLNGGRNSGTDLIIYELSKYLSANNWEIEIVAPDGSRLNDDAQAKITPTTGNVHESIQNIDADSHVSATEGDCIYNVWNYVKENISKYDAVINFSYHPHSYQQSLEIAESSTTPIFQNVQFAAKHNQTDKLIADYYKLYPKNVMFCSKGQAETFAQHGVNISKNGDNIVSLGVDTDTNKSPDGIKIPNKEETPVFAWAGRISPVKGLHIALEAVKRYNAKYKTSAKLKIMGSVSVADEDYWKPLQKTYDDIIDYKGNCNQEGLIRELATSHVFLQTHTWVEAFGMVMPQAMACGTPVIATRKGSPEDIITEGVSGYAIPPDDLFEDGNIMNFGAMDKMLEAMHKALSLNRTNVRAHAEQKLSTQSMGNRFNAFIVNAIGMHSLRSETATEEREKTLEG